MGGALEKVRDVVGSGLVRLGLRLLGYRERGSAAPFSEVEDEEEEGEPLPPNVPPVVLSETAKGMLADAVSFSPPKKDVVEEEPLKGSIADRMRTARREMGR